MQWILMALVLSASLWRPIERPRERISHRVVVAATETLRIDLPTGAVRLRAGATPDVRIGGRVDGCARSIELTRHGNELRLSVAACATAELEVSAPPQTRVRIRTRDAAVQIEGLEWARVERDFAAWTVR